MVRLVLLTTVVAAALVAPASGAETPIAVASATGSAAVTISGSGANRWHVVITTRPARLPVFVQVAGRAGRIRKAPVVLDYTCSECATRVTARLSASEGKPVSRTATIRAALYRR